MSTDYRYWLAATRIPGIGSAKLTHLLTLFGEIEKIFSATETALMHAGLATKEVHAIKNPDWKNIDADLIWCEKNKTHILTKQEASYPKSLREISSAPYLLYVRGDINVLSEPQLAIVGSRNPTSVGREMAQHFATSLTQAGLVITSGLALGIDAASHQGCLAANGKTIAVLGTGLQHIYPRANLELAEKIAAQGALISEFPPGTLAMAKNFPRRNRLISGLSLGVLVVEAALRSGSLITARCAAEQGREVFAIPGSIHNPVARGCHALIRQGAKLVETAHDILEELGALHLALSIADPCSGRPKLDPQLSHLLKQIGEEATTFDMIIHRSGLTVSEVSSMLLALELSGYVQVVPGGFARFSYF